MCDQDIGRRNKMGKGGRRTDKKSSRTAGFNCMYRAASFLSTDPYYHSNDCVAPRLLPKFLFLLVKNRLINFHWRFFPKGIYEYVVARTKYIDTVCETSIDDGIRQIAVIGAGFDSRSVRFTERDASIRVFELDTIYTQSEKIAQFQERRISIPDNVVFIPIDFNNESIQEKLQESGFHREERSLFILEGIIMYLATDAVSSLFTELYGLSAPGSKVVFDYVLASVLRRENRCYGEQNIYRKVKTVKESWTFGLEDGEVGEFIGRFGFELVENMNAEDLEKRYFTDEKKNLVARVNGTHAVAYASK
jgi:methyltransferase (TIGR00027 family)